MDARGLVQSQVFDASVGGGEPSGRGCAPRVVVVTNRGATKSTVYARIAGVTVTVSEYHLIVRSSGDTRRRGRTEARRERESFAEDVRHSNQWSPPKEAAWET